MYTYLAYELVTGKPIDEVPFTKFSWNEVLNRPGGWTAEISLTHPKATRNTIDPWRTAIYAVDETQIYWAGIVTAVEPSLADDRLTVRGLGVSEYYRHRTIRGPQGMTYAALAGSDVRFDDIDQFDIVADLIGHAHSYSGGNPFNIQLEYHGPGTGGRSGVLRERNFAIYEYRNVGETIERIADLINGLDFSFSWAWGIDGRPVTTMHLWYPRRGQDTRLLFSPDKNISTLTQPEDGTNLANDVNATGAGDGDAMLVAAAVDINKIYPAGTYPRLERTISHHSVSEQATLDAHALAELRFRQLPARTMRVDIIDTADVPLGSFSVGDDVRLAVTRGWLDIDEQWRVQQLSVDIGTEGQIAIAANLAPRDVSLLRDLEEDARDLIPVPELDAVDPIVIPVEAPVDVVIVNVTLDDNGNGYDDYTGPWTEILAVSPNSADPPTEGYLVPVCGAHDQAGNVRVVARGGPPAGTVDVRLLVMT